MTATWENAEAGDMIGREKVSPVAKQAIWHAAAARSRPSQRLLDALYGSQAAPLRAECAAILLSRGIVKSAKEAQYGRLRRSLLIAVGATGDCIASEDADFERRVAVVLNGGE